jgi:predicted kinase
MGAVDAPLVVMLVGPPGSGKTRFARRLASALGAQVVETDRVRKQLFSEPRYTGGEHAAVYGWCHALIRSAVIVGKPIIFDGTNLEERQRRKVYDIADAAGAPLLILWIASPASTIQERLLRRHTDRDEFDLSDADWSVYLDLRRRAEPIRRPHMVINTSTCFETLYDRLVQRISAPAAG